MIFKACDIIVEDGGNYDRFIWQMDVIFYSK